MKLKKFIKKFTTNYKDINNILVGYFDDDYYHYYHIKCLHDVYTNHKELLEKKVQHIKVLDNELYISIK